MALVLGDLYRALRQAGAEHETAMAAAHEAYVATRRGGLSRSADPPIRRSAFLGSRRMPPGSSSSIC